MTQGSCCVAVWKTTSSLGLIRRLVHEDGRTLALKPGATLEGMDVVQDDREGGVWLRSLLQRAVIVIGSAAFAHVVGIGTSDIFSLAEMIQTKSEKQRCIYPSGIFNQSRGAAK